MKLKLFIKAISDANECLKIEPKNIKALIRKGQAFVGEKLFSQAYDTFEKVLDIDGSNQIAHQEMFKLRKKIPPKNAFRMKIEEVEDYEELKALEAGNHPEALTKQELVKYQSDLKSKAASESSKTQETSKRVMKSEKLDLPETSHVPKMVKSIVVEEPTPFDKLSLKTKKIKPRETLIMPSNVQKNKKNILIEEIN